MGFPLLLFCIFVMVSCQGVESVTDEKIMKQEKYCGTGLSNTISMICNYISRMKKSNWGEYDGNGLSKYLEDEGNIDSKIPPLLAKKLDYLMYLKKDEKRISKTKVHTIDECCKQSCSLWELSAFCH